ncbi:MAG: cobalt-precorrin-5B (C(1))-methyltransferase [Methanotrichaceae archaeon]|nr:cobalt-precorrin-5B (C(1))-methyltransferase [Methanotrichaceae archaeon]
MSDPVIDPVTGFEVPKSWIELADDSHSIEKIRSGLFVLLSNGKLLRRGLTTGTTAAAVCKGAILSLCFPIDKVKVMTPAGIAVILPVKSERGFCMALKDGGDHQSDVTDGLEMVARANDSEEKELIFGCGIGRFTNSSLCFRLGHPAVSQLARKQIMHAIEEGLAETGLEFTRVELSVPKGEIIAKNTLNQQLGIAGGISILGTTGFVEPWNDHLGESRIEEINSLENVVVTTGRTGLKYSRILFPDYTVVLIGSQLDRLAFKETQSSIICGLPALILKWAWPQILEGTRYDTVARMVARDPDHPHISKALEKAKAKLPHSRIVLLHRDGKVFRDMP